MDAATVWAAVGALGTVAAAGIAAWAARQSRNAAQQANSAKVRFRIYPVAPARVKIQRDDMQKPADFPQPKRWLPSSAGAGMMSWPRSSS